VGDDGALVLDHCDRCGGVWFELGEVPRLRGYRPQALWTRIARRDEPFAMQCHACHALMARDDPACAACDWKNRLSCPHCDLPMEHAEHGGVRVDVCRSCKGVWFDHDELAAVWNEAFGRAISHRTGRTAAAGDGALSLMEALSYDPFLAFYGVHAAGHVLGASVDALAHAPGAAEGAIEAAGEVAGGVFETICEILGGLFS
jgi:Zn-finger nucleic acid-binding protein